ncbi:4-coumarate--CoA ligase-like 7 [Trichinella spiralis]|uniref:4-coumarate--CoA ligase-like 7 n=1 Tax=Trichinella spiralis TaxID=6334 RepID=A0A0V1BC77_TRISP|nr:4-coumarate--CoA ligase-like 7 [Trichinella spiralis]
MPIYSTIGDVKIEELTLHEYVLNAVVHYDEQTLLCIDSETGKSYTCRDVILIIQAIAMWLDGKVKKGDVVVICSSNTPYFMFTLLAVLLHGAVVSAVSATLTSREMSYQFKECQCKFVVTESENKNNVLKACEHLPDQIQHIFDMDDFSNLLLNEDGRSAETVVRELLVNFRFVTANDLAMMMFSSGTTGYPKAVMLTHCNVSSVVQILKCDAFQLIPEQNKVILGYLPFYHIYGNVLFLLGIVSGCKIVTMEHFKFEIFLQLIEKFKIENLFVVPPVLVMLLKHSNVDKHDISSVKKIIVGAAPIGKDLFDEVTKKFTHIKSIVQEIRKGISLGYGMTEVSGVSHITEPFSVKVRKGSCGRLLPNYECKVIDIESGEELPAGKSGEICLRSPTCTIGYFGNSAATQQLIDKNGWIHTGDIGYYDEDGDFFIQDRIKEMIKVKGFQVLCPAELEELLLSFPDITDAAVVGIPDTYCGEVPFAFVVKKPNSAITALEIAKNIEKQVASYKHLAEKHIAFVESIPKASTGKILRRKLRELIQFQPKI